jgi:Helix-turn-helix domain
MSVEVRDWLVMVLAEEPAVGRVIGEAIAVLFDTEPAEALIRPLEAVLSSREPLVALDDAYQRQLELLQTVRRSVRDIATRRKRQEQQSTDEPSRRRLEELQTMEEQATLASMRLQDEIDSFRGRKEVVKANYTTALAKLQINAVDKDEPPLDLADDLGNIRAIVDTTLRRIAEMERSLGAGTDNTNELRLEAADLRLLFATTADDTITFLVAGTTQEGWYSEALPLARAELQLENDEFITYDEPTFLSEYFPGHEAEIRTAAHQLVQRSLAQRLAQLREQANRTIDQVAEQMRTSPQEVTAMEQKGPRAATLGDLIEYVEALGGRLEVTAVFGTDRIAFH